MSLSVCFIARNEQNKLPRALRSVAPIADEMIVADTGSTDRTVELAAAGGARVYHFPWCDDFSAARNFALDQATCEWVLWLDADEELPSTSYESLMSCIARSDALAFFLARRDYCEHDNPDAFTLMWMPRLFRRHPRLCFRGRCHPDFDPSLEEVARAEGLQVVLSDVVFMHDGYLPEYMDSKLRRSAHLLELELRDRPGQLYYQILLARTLLAFDPDRGHRLMSDITGEMMRQLAAPLPPVPIAAIWMEYILETLAARPVPGFNSDQARALAERWFPNAAPILWLRARYAFEAGQWLEAEKLLRTLLAMGRDHSYDRYVNFHPRILGEDALLNLGVCLVRQTRLSEAEECFRQLLICAKHADQARRNLAIVQRLRTDSAHPRRHIGSSSEPEQRQ